MFLKFSLAFKSCVLIFPNRLNSKCHVKNKKQVLKMTTLSLTGTYFTENVENLV